VSSHPVGRVSLLLGLPCLQEPSALATAQTQESQLPAMAAAVEMETGAQARRGTMRIGRQGCTHFRNSRAGFSRSRKKAPIDLSVCVERDTSPHPYRHTARGKCRVHE